MLGFPALVSTAKHNSNPSSGHWRAVSSRFSEPPYVETRVIEEGSSVYLLHSSRPTGMSASVYSVGILEHSEVSTLLFVMNC